MENPVTKELVKYLLWKNLWGDGGAEFERAFTIRKMLVHSIEETPGEEVLF